MRFRFNPLYLFVPRSEPPRNETSSGGDSPPVVHAAPVHESQQGSNSPVQVEQVVDAASSAPTPSPAAMESLKLSPITIPTAHQSLQLSSQILATIGTDIGNVSCVATTSKDSRDAKVAFGTYDGKLFLFQPKIITTERDEANSNNSDSPPSLAVPFQGPESRVKSLVFSSDNTKLLVSWYDGKVMAFDAKDGKKLYECQAPNGLYDCAFSKDGKRVVIGGNDGWKMFDFDK